MAKLKAEGKEGPSALEAVEDLRIPPKAPVNQRIKSLRTEQVDTNCYKVTFQEKDVFRYEAKFLVTMEGRKEPKNIAEGQKNDVSTERRRMVLNDLYRQLITSKQEIFGTDPLGLLFDCGQTIYAARELTLDGVMKIPLNADSIDAKYRDYLPHRIAELYVELKFLEKIHVDSARVSMDETDADRSSLALIEMAFNQKIISNDKFHVFRQQCYLKEPVGGDRPREIQARVLKEGLAKGIRLCGENPKAPQLMLQTSVKLSAFYPELPLKDYLMKSFNCRDLRDLARLLRDDKRAYERASKDVKKLMLVTTHLPHNRLFICDGLDKTAIEKIGFERETRAPDGTVIKKQRVLVVDYMEQKYHRQRNECDRMPAVLQKTRDRDGGKVINHYPIDVLKVLDGQRLPLQKMDGKFQEAMIKEARMDPPTMKQTTDRLAKTAFLTAANPYANRFGLRMESNTIRTNADILHPPALQYAQNVAEEPGHDGRLAWRPPNNRRFLVAAKADRWVVINHYRCADQQMLDDFIRRFCDALAARGAVLNRKPTVAIESDAKRIFQLARDQRAEFLMVITKDKMDPIHDVLKHFELESKIVTQHLWQNTVFNIIRKNQNVTMENVIMKTNEKLGGTNFTIKTANKFAQDNRALPNVARIFETEWIAGRLFIGIDLSHGAPGARGGGTPTVVGVCYTYNEKLSMTGGWIIQEPRETIVQNLERTIENAILDYKNRSDKKAWPTHIIFYRAGVSDGEFRHVTLVEKRSVEKAFAALKNKPGFRIPGYTMIICQKNNTRLFPTQPPQAGPGGRVTDADKNVRPGTVITKDIVTPNMEQFVLLPQRGLIGTARPTVYTVVADVSPNKKRLEQKELTNITYALCHLHGGVMGTVSTPAVLYHAGAVAKRGRNNLKIHLYGTTDDVATVSSGHSGQGAPAEQGDDYHQNLSQTLAATLNTKYWC